MTKWELWQRSRVRERLMKNKNMKELIIFIVFIVVIFMGVIQLDYMQCKNNVIEMGREFRYDFINGCRVGLGDGKFIYWKMFREVE